MEKHLIPAILLISFIRYGYSATESPTTTDGQPDYLKYPYCFRFTWLGPKYDGSSVIGNATCSTLLEDSTGIPCKLPLIATNNSNLPDTDWLWEHHKKKPSEIACRLSRGDVCVKYSHIYNQADDGVIKQSKQKLNSIYNVKALRKSCAPCLYIKTNQPTVQNITYFCTKVTIVDDGAARVGTCYSQIQNGKEIEVCVCESTVGSTPCNDAVKEVIFVFVVALSLTINVLASF